MKKIGVIANCAKPDAKGVLDRLANKAKELGLELYACGESQEFLPDAQPAEANQLGSNVDALMALGGDGTMLDAVRTLGGAAVPVIGVNLGSLGFMTSVSEKDLERALESLVHGEYTTSSRAVLESTVLHQGKQAGPFRALNDVVFGWGDTSRVVTLKLAVDGEHVTSYLCDGVIVSTPTGSTGHSLSAGGPILHPETGVFLINVICPHALSTRPLVVSSESTLTIEVAESPKKLVFAVDGQESVSIAEGDRVEIQRSPRDVTFIHLPGYSYFSLLRQKLHWRGSSL